MLKKLLLLIIVLILFLLCGCVADTSCYQFVNPVNEIVSIELIQNNNNAGDAGIGIESENFLVLKTLESGEVEPFMNAVYALETQKCFSGPLWGFGQYIAKITYKNGDIEMLGSYNIEYIPVGSEISGFGPFHFDAEEFTDVFFDYVT